MIPNFSAENYGIFQVASVSPQVAIANPLKNLEYIIQEIERPEYKNSRFIVFPELCLTGYTCGDLFFQNSLLKETEKVISLLCDYLQNDSRMIAVGAPLRKNNKLYNCAIVIFRGTILGVVPKINIPNYQEFYEKRWFHSGRTVKNDVININGVPCAFGTDMIFSILDVKVGVEICEDLWVPVPPSSRLCQEGAEIILNLSATDDNIGKYKYIKNLVASQSARCRCGYAYASAGRGESSTDLIFSGINIIGIDGKIKTGERFSTTPSGCVANIDVEKLRNDRVKYSSFHKDSDNGGIPYRVIDYALDNNKVEWLHPVVKVDARPFIPFDSSELKSSCGEIVEIQSWGLIRRLEAMNCDKIVVGISGGLDSTLALLIAHNSLKKMGVDSKNIVAVTMPAQATSHRTHSNASKLMKLLGTTSLEIAIEEAVNQHFKDIKHDPANYNAVYENSQARERTQILMDLANKHKAMVLGTGDMSELALGWCTYNGDHMSMYNVNAGVPKTLVKYLVEWFALISPTEELKNVLLDIVATPISPELVPSDSQETIGQKTEELVGPYELHDFFMFHVVRNNFTPQKILFLAIKAFEEQYEEQEIIKWLINFYKRFFSQQFKRSCMPDGPKVGSVCLSPRGDWRMPSDATAKLWISEIENMSFFQPENE